MTDLQRTQAAYAHFTLEEWKLLAKCVGRTFGDLKGTRDALDLEEVKTLLSKFPSAALG